MLEKEDEWFKEWFDTPHYHLLYQERDYSEAEYFITNLLDYLKIPEGATCLDLACGKGRHSIYLNKKGLNVVGLDLSEYNITKAKKFENETLQFEVHDMREVYQEDSFNYVFNLFTSFGYFDDNEDNQKTLSAVHQMLKKDGVFVIDFMNAYHVIHHLVKEEVKTVEGIDFNLSRKYDGKYIIKDIEFNDKGMRYFFQERVQAIKKDEFESMLQQAGFEIIDIFGNFSLAPFDKIKSDRLIIIARKI